MRSVKEERLARCKGRRKKTEVEGAHPRSHREINWKERREIVGKHLAIATAETEGELMTPPLSLSLPLSFYLPIYLYLLFFSSSIFLIFYP